MHTIDRNSAYRPLPAAPAPFPRVRLTDAAPAAPSPAAPTASSVIAAPPIPPLPLTPVPYDCDAEGLTLRDLLQECIGHDIVAEHQVGISNLVTRKGRLVRVETNAYVMEDPATGDSLVCDYYSLKFFRCLAEGGK